VPISNESLMRADFGAKRSVHCTARLRLSMYCSPCFPLCSTLTVLDRLGDFALRISRREFCQEQQTDRRQMNADGDGLGRLESGGKSHWTKPLLRSKLTS
jgi:hypothetical protein